MKTTEIKNLLRVLKSISSEEVLVDISVNYLGARIQVTTKKGQTRQRTFPVDQLQAFDNPGIILSTQATEMVNELRQPAGG